ncbi:MAG: heme-binding domain-containing protein [Acidobacteriota bacterium]
MKYLITTAKIILVVLVVALIIVQFFGIDKSNAAIVQADTLEAAVTVPDNVEAILTRSCNNCHTNKTVYPWYASIQPVGWFLQNHINDGRKDLNFSQFNTYTGKKKVKRLEGACELVQKKEMPLPSYLWIHRDAVMSDADIQTLCDWANTEKAKISE